MSSLIPCLLLLCLEGRTQSQHAGYFPDVYNGYFYNKVLVSPSYLPDTGRMEVSLSHKLMSGPYRELSTTAFVAARYFSGAFHSQGLRLILGNEQEGEYINTPKAYLNYAYRLQLRSQWTLQTGLSLGTTGVYLSAPAASTSFYLPDGALSVGTTYRHTTLGFSSFQIFEASRYAFVMNRYYHIDLSGSYPLGPIWTLKGQGLWRLLPQAPDEYRAAVLANYQHRLEMGLGVKNYAGFSVMGSFVIPKSIGIHDLWISLVYNTYKFSKDRILPNSLELSLRILGY